MMSPEPVKSGGGVGGGGGGGGSGKAGGGGGDVSPSPFPLKSDSVGSGVAVPKAAGMGGRRSPGQETGITLQTDAPPPPPTQNFCTGPNDSNGTQQQSFCGVWLPWLSASDDKSSGGALDDPETLVDSICSASLLPDYAERVLPQMETLLDKHGIESVVYLPTKAGGQQPVGKKCMIRSKLTDPRIEFRVRSAGELKKMKFEWADIEEMGPGKNAAAVAAAASGKTSASGSNATSNLGFMYMKIKDRGTVDLRFESKSLRDATLMGFKLLQVKRQSLLA